MNSKICKQIVIMTFLFLLTSCEEVTDFYLGMPMQPEFSENTFREGMNIFGLLRPDSSAEFNKSFVFVQQNLPVLDFNDSSFLIIKYADIRLVQFENDVPVDTAFFPLLPPDSSFTDTLYRPAQLFNPVPGNSYQLLCTHDNLPPATGETLFPHKPEVVPGSIHILKEQIIFDVAPDETIKMFDIYVKSDVFSGITGRYVTNDTTSVRVIVSIPATDHAGIEIYGYDANLASYYANSNTSLNFNKYRTTFSTLEEGFGVFGSLNFTKFSVEM